MRIWPSGTNLIPSEFVHDSPGSGLKIFSKRAAKNICCCGSTCPSTEGTRNLLVRGQNLDRQGAPARGARMESSGRQLRIDRAGPSRPIELIGCDRAAI